ncbi:hypothetical protein F511_31258 [Dorcoceras hygrometricum]|uniref:Uncharacterized protein n=1 Tax=Dorcoceras hygrometricum TaxID=472368 RepID=A0A2Z7D7L1_9LAMI|nr:hypothetical protein F511_31258 [Dorcoceras hygrometricum]
MLLRKYLEARRKNFESGTPTTDIDLQILDILSDAHRSSLEELLKQMKEHKLEWIRLYKSRLFEGANVHHGAIIARYNTNIHSTCWIRYLFLINGSWTVQEGFDRWVRDRRAPIFEALSESILKDLVAVGPVVDRSGITRRTVNNVQYCIRIVDSISEPYIDTVAEEPVVNPDADSDSSSSTSSSDSPMHFTADDFPLGDETTAALTTDFTGTFAQLKASVDQISLEQVQSKFHLEKLKAELSKRISHLETALITASENQDRATLVQTNSLRKEMQDQKAAL